MQRSSDLCLVPLRERILATVEQHPAIRLDELVTHLATSGQQGSPPTAEEVTYHVERLDGEGRLLLGRFRWHPARWLFPEKATWLWDNENVRWLFRHPTSRHLALETACSRDPLTMAQATQRLGAGGLRARVAAWRLSRHGLVEELAVQADERLRATRTLERFATAVGWRRSHGPEEGARSR